MILSLAVILVPVLVITFLFTRNLDDHPVEVVDWRPVLSQARKEAPFNVLAPVNLPDEWRPIRVSWVKVGENETGGEPSPRNAWQLAYLDPDDRFVAIYQGDRERDNFLDSVTREGQVDPEQAEVTIEGQTWKRYVSKDERTRSLVQTSTKVTTIVVGDEEYEALEAFASTLRAE